MCVVGVDAVKEVIIAVVVAIAIAVVELEEEEQFLVPLQSFGRGNSGPASLDSKFGLPAKGSERALGLTTQGVVGHVLYSAKRSLVEPLDPTNQIRGLTAT